MELEKKLEQWTHEVVDGKDHFLVGIEKSKDRKYSILLDGDNGVNIGFCSEVSRYISRMVDENFPDGSIEAFTFEVSSPGVDRPLVQLRQLPKHVGRNLSFEENGSRKVAKLESLDGEKMIFSEMIKEKGKKAFENRFEKNFSELKELKVEVSFK